MKEVIYLMQERVRDNDWKTLHYTTGMDWQRAIEFATVQSERFGYQQQLDAMQRERLAGT